AEPLNGVLLITNHLPYLVDNRSSPRNAIVIARPVEQAVVGGVGVVGEAGAVVEDVVADEAPAGLKGGAQDVGGVAVEQVLQIAHGLLHHGIGAPFDV